MILNFLILILLLLLLMNLILLIIPLLPRTKVYMDLIIICLFAKHWPFVEPKATLSVGKFSVEKIEALGP